MPFPSRSYELLLACTQSERDDQKIEHCAREIEDWDDLLHLAYLHGIYPLVAKALKTITTIPEPVKIALKQKNTQIAQSNMVMSLELIRVIDLLENNKIRAIAIKGPVLSQMLYGNVIQRQYADLDIVVKESDMYDTVHFLYTLGYRPDRDIEFLKNRALMEVGKDFIVTHVTSGIQIEIHWRLFLEKHVISENIPLFNEQSLPILINNYPIVTLDIPILLLYLLLHGSNHFWERLEWIVDIDRFIRLYQYVIDWKVLLDSAIEMEIEEILYLGLSVSYELFSTPLEPMLLEKIAQMEIVRARSEIMDNIYRNGIKKECDHMVSIDTFKKMGLLKDRHNRWLRRYLLTIFQINELDIYEVNLPYVLRWLYYPIRLFRLFKLNILRVSPKH